MGTGVMAELRPEHKLPALRTLIELARANTTDLEVFAAAEKMGVADGSWLAGQLGPEITSLLGDANVVELVIATLEKFLADRKLHFVREGVPVLEVEAYAAVATLKVCEALESIQEDLQAADRSGRH